MAVKKDGFRLDLTIIYSSETYPFALMSDHMIESWNQELVLACFEHQVAHKEMFQFDH